MDSVCGFPIICRRRLISSKDVSLPFQSPSLFCYFSSNLHPHFLPFYSTPSLLTFVDWRPQPCRRLYRHLHNPYPSLRIVGARTPPSPSEKPGATITSSTCLYCTSLNVYLYRHGSNDPNRLRTTLLLLSFFIADSLLQALDQRKLSKLHLFALDSEARALLERLEYQKGNIEAVLHVFEGTDIAAVILKMKLSIARRVEKFKCHSNNDATLLMSMHAVSLLSKGIVLKSKSLQVLGKLEVWKLGKRLLEKC
ncbi:uncharacterized protein LOC122069073 [Macadamia integrifolia]|uniref:uncharacterized protein LOC122069073 n=1 Tax=Macadamia integrifolia TaxID=60698 RepID=UPI001C4E4163|nr:uncharacterized protein LOC122069073 [Macadamia integrifolia]